MNLIRENGIEEMNNVNNVKVRVAVVSARKSKQGQAAGHGHIPRVPFGGKGGSTSAYISTIARTPRTSSIGPSRGLTHKTMCFSICLKE